MPDLPIQLRFTLTIEPNDLRRLLDAMPKALAPESRAAPEKSSTAESPLMTLDEAAKYLRASRRTIERWAADGDIAVVKYKRLILIAKEECDRFIQKSTVAATNREDTV